MKPIYYITTEIEYNQAKASQEIRPASLAKEGFVHCSFAYQVTRVANRYFNGQDNLLVLKIDSAKLASKVIEENTSGGSELYPHIYGPLFLNSVQSVTNLKRRSDGSFEFNEN